MPDKAKTEVPDGRFVVKCGKCGYPAADHGYDAQRAQAVAEDMNRLRMPCPNCGAGRSYRARPGAAAAE